MMPNAYFNKIDFEKFKDYCNKHELQEHVEVLFPPKEYKAVNYVDQLCKDFNRTACILTSNNFDANAYADSKNRFFTAGPDYIQGQTESRTIAHANHLLLWVGMTLDKDGVPYITKLETLSFRYTNDQGVNSGFSITLDPNNPSIWFMSCSLHVEKPLHEHDVFVCISNDCIEYFNPEKREFYYDSVDAYTKQNNMFKYVKDNFKSKNIQTGIDELLTHLNSEKIAKIVKLIFSDNDQINLKQFETMYKALFKLHPPVVKQESTGTIQEDKPEAIEIFLQSQKDFNDYVNNSYKELEEKQKNKTNFLKNKKVQQREDAFKTTAQVFFGTGITIIAAAGIVAATFSTAVALSIISTILWPILVPATILAITYTGYKLLTHSKETKDNSSEVEIEEKIDTSSTPTSDMDESTEDDDVNDEDTLNFTKPTPMGDESSSRPKPEDQQQHSNDNMLPKYDDDNDNDYTDERPRPGH